MSDFFFFLLNWGLPVIHMPLTAVCQLPIFTNYPWSARGCRLPEVCQLSAVCGTLIPGVVTSHSGESVPLLSGSTLSRSTSSQ